MEYLRSIISWTSPAMASAVAGQMYEIVSPLRITPRHCISFVVAAGTGCAWMCEYCANNLGTNNYFFPDGVCTYAPGGCQGNPVAGVTYTCCSN